MENSARPCICLHNTIQYFSLEHVPHHLVSLFCEHETSGCKTTIMM